MIKERFWDYVIISFGGIGVGAAFGVLICKYCGAF
jgi:hypothetical protein